MKPITLEYVAPEEYAGVDPQPLRVVGAAAAGTPGATGPAGAKGDKGDPGTAGAPGYPALPTADGTYVLKVTRTAGAGAPAWVIEA